MRFAGHALPSSSNPPEPLEAEIPDLPFYRPTFMPWLGFGDFKHAYLPVRRHAVVGPDRAYVLYSLLRQAITLPGDVWECGPRDGGTAMMLALLLDEWSAGKKRLQLFDGFEHPEAAAPGRDDDDHGAPRRSGPPLLSSAFVSVHPGFTPGRHAGLEDSRVCLAHIDAALHRTVAECTEFVYPRVTTGGFIVYDDYGFASAPGARRAVDEFFRDKPEAPLALPTGQAIVFKT